MRNKNFVRQKQAIYISPNKKSTRIIKTLMDFFFFIKIKIKMVCFSVPSLLGGGMNAAITIHRQMENGKQLRFFRFPFVEPCAIINTEHMFYTD